MKALIYCRVSSVRQVVEGHGLSSQEQRCRTYAFSKHYDVIETFPDDGVSGGLFDRPAMHELIKYLDNHPNEQFVIIFDDLSRFARDLRVYLKLKTEIIDRGAKLESPNFTYEDTPEGEFIENVIASKAQLDRQQNRRQVIQKMKARLESGYWAFGLPPGLKNTHRPPHGNIAIPDEPIASILKTAIESYRDRILITQFDVVNFINNQYKQLGVKKNISLHGAQKVLTNILYAGWIEFPDWGVSRRKAQFDGFITIDTYNQVQQIINDRTKIRIRKDTNPAFPLRGLSLCSNCHKPHTASYHHGRHGQLYPHYFCKTLGCPLKDKSIHKTKIEGDFIKLLAGLTLDQSSKNLATTVLTNVWERQKNEYTNTAHVHNKQLQEIITAITRITERISKTTNDTLIRTYETELLKLGKKKEEFDNISYSTQYTDGQFGTATQKVFEILEKPADMWKNGSLDDRLTVFFMYFDKKPIYDKEKGFGTPVLSQSIELIRSLGSAKISSVEMPGIEPGSESIHCNVYKRSPFNFSYS